VLWLASLVSIISQVGVNCLCLQSVLAVLCRMMLAKSVSLCKVRGKPSQRVFWRPCPVVRRVINMHQAKRIAVALSPLEIV